MSYQTDVRKLRRNVVLLSLLFIVAISIHLFKPEEKRDSGLAWLFGLTAGAMLLVAFVHVSAERKKVNEVLTESKQALQQLRVDEPHGSAKPIPSSRVWPHWRLLAFWISIPAGYALFQVWHHYVDKAAVFTMPFLIWSLIGVLVVIPIKWTDMQRQGATIRDASEGIDRGELTRARDVLWRAAESTRLARFSVAARHNLAWTFMRQGELQHAVAVLRDNDRRHAGPLILFQLWPTSAVDLALDYALLGELDTAEKWLAESARRATRLGSTASLPGIGALTRAVVECRRGRYDAAATTLQDPAAVLLGRNGKLIDVVRAFTLAKVNPDDPNVAKIVEGAKPIYDGEYQCLGVAWPEMQTFLATYGLTAQPAPAD